MTLSPAFLDELRARTQLSALIGRTTKLSRAGREWKAPCPFHNEKTPSFYVNDDKGFYHCLAGETIVITSTGRFPISQLAGGVHTILSRQGAWLPAPFKSYGEQRLWKIALSRNGLTKTLFATSGHRWFVNGRASPATTLELRPGHALHAVRSNAPTPCSLDPEGVRHGIMFGDGTMYKRVYGTINLHGAKDAELRDWFPDQPHHVHARDGGTSYIRVYGGRAFERMKVIPGLDLPPPYLFGFLAGYLAADGHVAKDGTVMLNSANASVLEAVRDIATSLGITTYGRTTQMRSGFGKEPSALHRIHFVPSTMSEAMFVLSKARERFSASRKKFARLRWVVCSVEETDRIETVYCAEVPGEHAFVLDDNILTGNCFGCSAHGDAIRWLTDQRGLPFMDAVKELAQSAGMELPAPDPRAAAVQERALGLHEACAAAQAWFVEQLGGIEGAEARAYLARRGIGAAAVRDFGLGFAPDARGKLRAALKQYGDDLLVEAGLLIKVDDKEPYDRFRGRLMIPIRDQRGRVIAFGGRIIGDGEPKYLNSPETPLFDKGRTLYNLDKAAPAARTANRLIVVEGYLDVIALAQVGIAEAVAPLGTAITEAQLERLWRVTPVPLLCFDGDSAGQKAAVRVITRALPQLGAERSLGFVNLPVGQDPDDIVRAGGRAAIDALLDAPEPLVERLWRYELAAQPLDTPEGRAGLKQRVVEQARAIEDRDVRDQYLADLRRRLDALYAEAPRRFVPGQGRLNFDRRPDGPPRAPSSASRAISSIGIDPMMGREILAGLLRHPAILADCLDTLSLLVIGDPELERLRRFLLDRALLGDPLEAASVQTILEEAGFGALATDLLKANRMRFSFAREKSGPAVALRDLKLALEAIASEVELDAAIAEVTGKLADASDDSYFREQLRLTAARKDARDRLAALAEREGEAATQERQAELNGEDERRR